MFFKYELVCDTLHHLVQFMENVLKAFDFIVNQRSMNPWLIIMAKPF